MAGIVSPPARGPLVMPDTTLRAVRWLVAGIVAFLVGALLGLWAIREPEGESLWRDLERVETV